MKKVIKKNNQLFVGFSIFCLCLPFFSSAQSLTEKLGGVPTNFVITSDTNTLEVISQMIIKRGEYYAEYRDDYEGSSAYGYGYQSFHLEFMSRQPIYHKSVYDGNIRWRDMKSELYVSFYDEADNLLLNAKMPPSFLKIVDENTGLFSYSLNLVDYPIVLLDKTKRINIWQYSLSRLKSSY